MGVVRAYNWLQSGNTSLQATFVLGIILLHQMLCYFQLLWVNTLLSRPLPLWITPCIITEHQCKWRLHKEILPSLILREWHQDMVFQNFETIFCYQTPIDAALEISWHYVTLCTFSHLYDKTDTPANNKMDPDVQGTLLMQLFIQVFNPNSQYKDYWLGSLATPRINCYNKQPS